MKFSIPGRNPTLSSILAVVLTSVVACVFTGNLVAQSESSPAKRVDYDIKYLSSDELEGREPGSRGIATASEYIIDEFKAYGVKSGTEDGTFRQSFEIDMGTTVDSENCQLIFRQGDSEESMIPLTINDEFRPLMVGARGEVTAADLVFVGYGISDEANNYLEYKGVDVDGKVVVFLRMEPQQNDPASVFDGTDNSQNASISRKLQVAQEHGAVAAILINDQVRATDDETDELAQPDQFGRAGGESIPFFQVKRAAIEQLLEKSPLTAPSGEELGSLAEIENLIDQNLEPLSQTIGSWNVTANSAWSANRVSTDNIVGIVEGEGPNADQTVLIGGHYDHLGFGGYGSNAPGRREIHNGADDNATGTAGVVELARRFAQSQKKPGRRLVFVAFSGEERGLLGSAYYVENPLFPIENTVAMINYDMIGRLRDDKLTIFGTGTAEMFDAALEKANDTEHPLVLSKQESPFAGSDHMAFVRKQVPVMFLHTGLTDIYHTPEDDYETLNIDGAVRVIDYTERLIRELADAEQAPVYTEVTRARRSRAWLGARLDYEKDERGALVDELTKDAPAYAAGMEVGDVILTIDGEEITDARGLASLLGDKEPGDEIKVVFIRGDKEESVTVELGRTPRRRRGADN